MVVLKKVVSIRLYGPFDCRLANGKSSLPLGVKASAVLALLVSAPNGARTRAWLQHTLWPLSGQQHGRASLRQALTKLRKSFGDDFDRLFTTDNQKIAIDLLEVEFVGTSDDGEFLEGFDIQGADEFEAWLRRRRQKSDALPPFPSARAEPVKLIQSKLLPVLAVVPLVVLDKSPETAMLGDLIASDISRHVSHSNSFGVLSHLSCRSTEIQGADFFRLRKSFGVDFLVSGHVRFAGNRVCMDIDVVEVQTARIIASNRFDDALENLLEGESGVFPQIRGFLNEAAHRNAVESCADRDATDLEGHSLLMSAIVLMHRQDIRSVRSSKAQLDQVLERFPSSSLALAWNAYWHVLFVAQGWSSDLRGDAELAMKFSQSAVTCNPLCTFSRVILGLVQFQLQRNFDAATETFHLATQENPNNALGWLMHGNMLAFSGQGEDAVRYTTRARHLSPKDPAQYLFETISATAHLAAEQYEQALDLVDASLKINPNHLSSLRTKIIALHFLDQSDEAEAFSKQLLDRDPEMTVGKYLANHAAAKFDTGKKWAEALGASGVPREL